MSRITEDQIDQILEQSEFEDTKLGAKTTVVVCTLPNGFEVVGSSSCVDPERYDHDLGRSIALRRIKDRVWELEGFLLQNEEWTESLEREV